MEAVLFPTADYTPELRPIVKVLLDGLNATKLLILDGSGRCPHFRLGKNRELNFAIVPEQNGVF